jgi:hypothetical protein
VLIKLAGGNYLATGNSLLTLSGFTEGENIQT